MLDNQKVTIAEGEVIYATYQDGSLVLDRKLDAAFEGKRLTLVVVENTTSIQDGEKQALEPRKQRFLEQLKQHSFTIPTDYTFDREELHER